jgi:hypothetical protein
VYTVSIVPQPAEDQSQIQPEIDAGGIGVSVTGELIAPTGLPQVIRSTVAPPLISRQPKNAANNDSEQLEDMLGTGLTLHQSNPSNT